MENICSYIKTLKEPQYTDIKDKMKRKESRKKNLYPG